MIAAMDVIQYFQKDTYLIFPYASGKFEIKRCLGCECLTESTHSNSAFLNKEKNEERKYINVLLENSEPYQHFFGAPQNIGTPRPLTELFPSKLPDELGNYYVAFLTKDGKKNQGQISFKSQPGCSNVFELACKEQEIEAVKENFTYFVINTMNVLHHGDKMIK